MTVVHVEVVIRIDLNWVVLLLGLMMAEMNGMVEITTVAI